MPDMAFAGYEYREIAVKGGMASVYADGYQNLGWKLEGSRFSIKKPDSIIMKFKRDRKIRNKPELNRLQQRFDALASEIVLLEASKRTEASIVAYIVGIIGTAFMACSVFAITSELLITCIILAVPAFIGWLLPYFLYRYLEKRRTSEVNPLIDSKYDELYTVCEKADGLLDQVG